MSFFSPDLIDFLIRMEKIKQKEQENEQIRPFLELPVPYLEENPQKIDENDENTGEIVIDLQ